MKQSVLDTLFQLLSEPLTSRPCRSDFTEVRVGEQRPTLTLFLFEYIWRPILDRGYGDSLSRHEFRELFRGQDVDRIEDVFYRINNSGRLITFEEFLDAVCRMPEEAFRRMVAAAARVPTISPTTEPLGPSETPPVHVHESDVGKDTMSPERVMPVDRAAHNACTLTHDMGQSGMVLDIMSPGDRTPCNVVVSDKDHERLHHAPYNLSSWAIHSHHPLFGYGNAYNTVTAPTTLTKPRKKRFSAGRCTVL